MHAREKRKREGEGTKGRRGGEEEKGSVVTDGKKRKDTLCVSFRGRQPRARPHTKSTRKKKIGPRCGCDSHRTE